MDQPKIERVLRLMKLMTGNVDYTVNELAEKLDTSYRSIYRYIETFKDAGFVIHKLDGGIYKLGKESRYFKEISQLIHFTDEEAHIFNQLIDGLDDTNLLKQNLRKKLASVYDCTSMANSIVKGKNAQNVNRLVEAIQEKRQVILKGYSSSHGSDIRDRHVEPFGFTSNYVQLWCYDLESCSNKLFKASRISEVEILPEGWIHEDGHNKGYEDIFRITSNTRHRVRLELGILSHNLLVEEYPLAERDLTQTDEQHWLLDTLVSSMIGVGRFVIGLAHDIRIIDSPELEEYIRNYTKEHLTKQYRQI